MQNAVFAEITHHGLFDRCRVVAVVKGARTAEKIDILAAVLVNDGGTGRAYVNGSELSAVPTDIRFMARKGIRTV